MLDGLHVIEVDGVKDTRYKHWCGANPAFVSNLRTWGEAGTVTVKSLATPKIADRGIQCMMVGYPPDHTSDCYEMWDPATGGVHTTRDIIWLKRMYFEKLIRLPPPEIDTQGGDLAVKIPQAVILGAGEDNVQLGYETTDNETTEAEEGNENETEVENEPEAEAASEGTRTRSGRAVRMPERLIEEMRQQAIMRSS